MIRYHSTKLMTRRWTMVVFFNLVDISPMNAIIIWVKLQTYLHSRRSVRCALLMTLAKSIAGITTNYNPLFRDPFPPFVSCLRKYEDEKEMLLFPSKKHKKSKIYCENCQQRIFGGHSVNICLQFMKQDLLVMFSYIF